MLRVDKEKLVFDVKQEKPVDVTDSLLITNP